MSRGLSMVIVLPWVSAVKGKMGCLCGTDHCLLPQRGVMRWWVKWVILLLLVVELLHGFCGVCGIRLVRIFEGASRLWCTSGGVFVGCDFFLRWIRSRFMVVVLWSD